MYNLVQVMTGKIKLLRIKEAAELLSVNPQTLRRWDNEGRLKAIRIGKRQDRRYKLEDIQKIIDGKRINYE
ncbi:helix-turn-helix domain-containing protein [Candidatus Daviesbacteria bacterium]|nr:helix-turn-helix domain-containing protein [Candidatus Daviesbacteria bacterium]